MNFRKRFYFNKDSPTEIVDKGPSLFACWVLVMLLTAHFIITDLTTDTNPPAQWYTEANEDCVNVGDMEPLHPKLQSFMEEYIP